MKVFQDLAAGIHLAWMKFDRDERAFPEVARDAIAEFGPAWRVTLDEVLSWIATADCIPRQFDRYSAFSNFALTVARHDDFLVDVLVWTDSTTAIHQHSFCGAFHVLQGSSLHTLWSFEEQRRWSDRLKSGRLRVSATEWLKQGSTRRIEPGSSMIHSLFHLDSPSVTVVVRTPSSAVLSPQLCYQRPGLAYDQQIEWERVEKVRQLLALIWEAGHPDRVSLSEAAIGGLDAHSAVRIALSGLPAAASACVARTIGAREPELGKLLQATLESIERDRGLVRLRKQTQSARHRMLLALVLNLPDRASIDSVVKQIAPDELPESWLWDTIRSMHDTPAERSERASVLGFELNEISEETLRMLLHGHSIEEVSWAVAGHEQLVDDVRQLCSTLAAMPVLGPLLEQRLALEAH